MIKVMTFDRDRFTFNAVFNFMMKSFEMTCLFMEEMGSLFFPLARVYILVFRFEERVKGFRNYSSSDEWSSISTNEEFVFDLPLLLILGRIGRFDAITFELLFCKFESIDFNEMLNFRRLLILYFQPIFISLVLWEVFEHFKNCMHRFCWNGDHWLKRILLGSWRSWLRRQFS